MKKVLCTVLSICMLLMLIGCGSTEEAEVSTTDEIESVTDEIDGTEETESMTDEMENTDETESVVEETEAAANDNNDDEYLYNAALYSDEYVEISLVSISFDNAYFSVKNVSDQTIQVDCEYFQLDDTKYSYEDTNYSTPITLIVSGDTIEYEFCDYSMGNETDFQIANPDCTVFSGSFEIWDELGNLLENANISDVSLK